jgi:sortase A
MLNILQETFTYEVDQILIVEPEDLSGLTLEEDKDLCTLITCTPYGVNSHRLLVRCHRVENLKESVHVTADAMQIEPILVAPAVAIPIILILFIWVMFFYRKE